jgi:thioredoxin 1
MNRMMRILLLVTLCLLWQCKGGKSDHDARDAMDSNHTGKAKVTFVELGSVNCIPCKAMQPVMKAVTEEYGDQIKVVFHDVWKDAEPGRKYGIRLIPTQVFLDEKGVEFHRHEGFYPKEDIDKLLQARGLNKKQVQADGHD